jgi:NLR family CARD domain-containing protein 3
LKTLNLSNNNIGDEGAIYLAEVLKIKRTLNELHLNDNHISDGGVQSLANALCVSTTNLRKLYLHNNRQISDSSVDCLVHMLKRNRWLNTLWLINCDLTNAGRQRLTEFIASKNNFYLNVEKFDH